MSAHVVREAFRAKVNGLLADEGFEFVESMNHAESTKTLPERWYTLDFPQAQEDPISLGTPTRFRERGRCVVFIFTPQQQQDTEALAAAEVVRAQMVHFSDLGGDLRVNTAEPPNDLDGGDFRGAAYGVAVELLYSYDRFA